MTENSPRKLGTLPFVIGGMSFIPAVGVLFGIVAIIWGVVTKREGGGRLIKIGSAGIAFSVILYSALFYFGFAQRGGVYDELRVKLAETNLTSLVSAIEFFKAQNGKYPESLEALQKAQPEGSALFVMDPTDVQAANKPRYFYFELVGDDHYYLLGVGPDGKPFTRDDQNPKIDSRPGSKIGFIRKGQQ